MTALQAQARELLAAAYEAEGLEGAADRVRNAWQYALTTHEPAAIRAILTALEAKSAVDRPFLLAAARIWWERNMGGHIRSVDIKGDGRVCVSWSDANESGKYTLPVDYIAELEAKSADREAIARALAERFIARGKARIIGSPYERFEDMPPSYRNDFLADADAIIATLTSPSALPAEPTEAMRRAGGLAINPDEDVLSVTSEEAAQAYRAMIALATPIASPGEGK